MSRTTEDGCRVHLVDGRFYCDDPMNVRLRVGHYSNRFTKIASRCERALIPLFSERDEIPSFFVRFDIHIETRSRRSRAGNRWSGRKQNKHIRVSVPNSQHRPIRLIYNPLL